MEVLNGAILSLARNRVFIIIELDEFALAARGSSSKELLNRLNTLGYTPWDVSSKVFYQEKELLGLLERRTCTDLLFAPRRD
jgi:hypothetical protein